MKYTHTRILVNDFVASYRFYKGIMDFKPIMGKESDVYAEFKAGHCIIGIFKKELMSQVLKTQELSASPQRQDPIVLCFAVHDVNAVYKKLSEKGVKFTTKPHDQEQWFIRVAHFRDPDGNCLEINSPLKE